MPPGFAAASDQGGNWRARHVNRSSADLPNVQVGDAAGPHLRREQATRATRYVFLSG
jgi:hypothetical protein